MKYFTLPGVTANGDAGTVTEFKSETGFVAATISTPLAILTAKEDQYIDTKSARVAMFVVGGIAWLFGGTQGRNRAEANQPRLLPVPFGP